uniref:MazG-like nucleotide pyrophosphohydrolase n=1 Tax=Pseudomonas phage Arace01 TaxID=3138526 RepID=A0AAU6VZT4_9VIRU
MTQDTLANTIHWFQKARPNPTVQDFSTQLGVHFEEVREMTLALKANTIEAQTALNHAEYALRVMSNLLKTNPEAIGVNDPLEMLDGLCDQVVTATGVAHTLGYDFFGAMTEVNASNFSKFDEEGKPIFNENKKVMKGANYFKAELTPFLNLRGVLQGS